MSLSRRKLFFAALLAAAGLAFWGLLPRLKAEQNNRTVTFVVENRDIVSLAYQSGKSPLEVWKILEAHGVKGNAVMEFTGEDLVNLQPLPLKFGAAGALGVGGGISQDRAVLVVEPSSPHAQLIYDYLSVKLPLVGRKVMANGETVLVLPGSVETFRQSALVPDFQGLDACRGNNITVIFRPGPCFVADGNRVADSLRWLAEKYPQIKSVLPSGAIMAGYPDLTPLAGAMKDLGISFAQAEFVNQVGVSNMARLTASDTITLHSLTREEIISRKMQRRQIRERFVRAVHERSIRILIMRPYDLQTGRRLEVFVEDLDAVRGDIGERGYSFGWPGTFPSWPAPLAGVFAAAISFLFCAWFYAARLLGFEDDKASPLEFGCLVLLSLACAGLLWKVPSAARLAGGLGAAAVAAEAALAALERHRKPAAGLILGLFVILAGGLSVASFYGTPQAALRLTPFSGVKFTLLLPPLLILFHDFRRKVHPESIGDIISRPAVWGELLLFGVTLLAMLIMTLRSDNFSSVPAWETAFRDFMERALLVRPRTKEFMVGYPALLLYYYVVRKGMAERYREVLRIAASLAFSTAINTFCHFHTVLILSAARVLNGWWVGILVGLALVGAVHYAGIPLWKKGLREAFH